MSNQFVRGDFELLRTIDLYKTDDPSLRDYIEHTKCLLQEHETEAMFGRRQLELLERERDLRIMRRQNASASPAAPDSPK